MTKIIFVIFLFTLFLSTIYYLPSTIYSQSDITNVFDITDKDTEDGDILIFTPEKGITRTNIAYDIHLFGVLQESPLLVFQRVDETGQPVARSGIAEVHVTTFNGPIKAGDGITSSEISGYGMKATISGHIIGVATSDFDETTGESIAYKDKQIVQGRVPVAVKIEYADLTTARSTNRLFQYIGASFFRNVQDPAGFGLLLKSLIAGVIILLSLAFGFIIISRSLPKAIEAIGRNPLARRSIILSIGLNIGFAIGITIVAIIASLIILRL